MKKFLLLISIFYFIGTARIFSQTYNYTTFKGISIFEDYAYENKGDSTMRANKIASLQRTRTKQKKGKSKIADIYVCHYDEQGRTVSVETFNGKNILEWGYYYEYDAKGKLISYTFYDRKRYRKSAYIFDNNREPVKIINYKGSSKESMMMIGYTVNTFNADSNKTSSITYTHKPDRPDRIEAKVLYEYDTLKKIGSAKMFDKKGKLVHFWNFDCNKKGEIDKKGKEENICKNRVELANGHYQEITITESKDNIYREISEYNEKHIQVMTEKYGGKYGTELQSKTEQSQSGDTSYFKIAEYIKLWGKNMSTYKSEYVYVKNKTVREHNETYWNKKLEESHTYTYTYDSFGLIKEEMESDETKNTANTAVYMYSRF